MEVAYRASKGVLIGEGIIYNDTSFLWYGKRNSFWKNLNMTANPSLVSPVLFLIV